MPTKPHLSSYGDSGSTYKGVKVTDGDPQNNIAIGVGENRITDTPDYSDFEFTVRDYVLANLGYPVVKVELSETQVKMAVDEAITFLDYHAPLWTTQFVVFNASAGENMYELPQHIVNNIDYVVYKKNLLAIQAQSNTIEFDFFIKYFQENFLFSDFSVSDYYILQMSLEQMRKILSQEGSWDIINNKYIQLQPFPATTPDPVIVVYRAIDPTTIHPMYRNWIQRYALAKSMTILARIRGKYVHLPGPGGGATLDGKELGEEGRTLMDELRRELVEDLEEPVPISTY